LLSSDRTVRLIKANSGHRDPWPVWPRPELISRPRKRPTRGPNREGHNFPRQQFLSVPEHHKTRMDAVGQVGTRRARDPRAAPRVRAHTLSEQHPGSEPTRCQSPQALAAWVLPKAFQLGPGRAGRRFSLKQPTSSRV
jgi:hypothetical protein